jgi:hypothetical protein
MGVIGLLEIRCFLFSSLLWLTDSALGPLVVCIVLFVCLGLFS